MLFASDATYWYTWRKAFLITEDNRAVPDGLDRLSEWATFISAASSIILAGLAVAALFTSMSKFTKNGERVANAPK